MAMDTVTATNTVIAIPTSIIMVMAMDMVEMKNNKNLQFNYIVIKKTTALRWFFYGCYF